MSAMHWHWTSNSINHSSMQLFSSNWTNRIIYASHSWMHFPSLHMWLQCSIELQLSLRNSKWHIILLDVISFLDKCAMLRAVRADKSYICKSSNASMFPFLVWISEAYSTKNRSAHDCGRHVLWFKRTVFFWLDSLTLVCLYLKSIAHPQDAPKRPTNLIFNRMWRAIRKTCAEHWTNGQEGLSVRPKGRHHARICHYIRMKCECHAERPFDKAYMDWIEKAVADESHANRLFPKDDLMVVVEIAQRIKCILKYPAKNLTC